jgi:hypothetical protein
LNSVCNYVQETLLGGRRPANLSDPYIQQMAEFALSELDHASNSLYVRQVVRVVAAETQVTVFWQGQTSHSQLTSTKQFWYHCKLQVVAGTLTHLTLELGYSNCSKNRPREQCSLQAKKVTLWTGNIIIDSLVTHWLHLCLRIGRFAQWQCGTDPGSIRRSCRTHPAPQLEGEPKEWV